MDHPKRRWYDQHPGVFEFIETVQVFPEDIQSIICESIVDLANTNFSAERILTNFRSLGPEKVLSFYKSKHKRRSYDNTPMVHKLMNYNQVLTHDQRLFMMKQANELIRFTEDYFGLCKTYDTVPSTQDVSTITQEYTKKGPENARAYLRQVTEIFDLKVQERKARESKIQIDDDRVRS